MEQTLGVMDDDEGKLGASVQRDLDELPIESGRIIPYPIWTQHEILYSHKIQTGKSNFHCWVSPSPESIGYPISS
ncbi:hypothetical protein EVAR_44562_1 [Eumeta japonica]|uniref:Uncharacterized protein n=1 Tax=Eumeta variegata TaxID=151549 RepID=A0A4C1X7W2_EUMVA|nr:hypothetical protein EVAR_44562_1 [Eumeta japonica]